MLDRQNPIPLFLGLVATIESTFKHAWRDNAFLRLSLLGTFFDETNVVHLVIQCRFNLVQFVEKPIQGLHANRAGGEGPRALQPS